MKTISLWQPWASAIAAGVKMVETRSWGTSYRGPLAIHAAKRWTAAEERFWIEHVYALDGSDTESAFANIGIVTSNQLPLGMIVATCELYDCVSTNLDPENGLPHECAPDEYEWGDFSLNRFAWFLRNVKPLKTPVPYTGRQGFFDWQPPSLTAAPDA